MVFEVYGNYVEGLEQDAMKILTYFGEDFLFPNGRMPQMIQMQQMPNGYGYLPPAVELPQVAYAAA
jgi:hypothetical protein